jgi:hypothetical protein
MHIRNVIGAIAAGALALVLGAGAASAEDTVVATVPAQTQIDALGGHLLWSVPDATGGKWQLIDRVNGADHPLAIDKSVEPFDVDLGRDRRGRLVAVYSRCREPLAESGSNFGRRGCDVYRYDVSAARETKIARIATRHADEYEPSLWGSRIAFLRVKPGRNEHLHVRNLRTGRDVTPTRVGSVLWDLDQRSRATAVRSAGEFSEQVRLAALGHRTRALLATPGSGAAAQEYATVHPTFADSHTVYWGLASTSPDWGEVWRRDVRKRRDEHATVRFAAPIVLFAQDRRVSYYAVDRDISDQGSPLELHRVDGLTFAPAPKLTLDENG